MSQENVEIAKRGYAAVNHAYETGDLTGLKQHLEENLTPDFVMRTGGSWPEHGEWHGAAGLLQFTANQMDALSDMWIEAEDFVDAGDVLVVPLRLGGRARHTGIEVELPAAHVWTVRAGKAARLETYADKAEALKAVGLSE
jgi:ketosteroid isomerase-like protein